MRRFIFVFIFALVSASVVSFGLYYAFRSRVGPTEKPAPTSQVAVATSDIQVGALLTASDIDTVRWPNTAPPQAINKPSDAVGRGVVATIYKGEPILSSRLALPGAGVGLAATIPSGKRAVALKVNDVIGLAGFVLPGMHVDVIASGSVSAASGTTGGLLSRTVLQNIEVISAGQKLERSNDGKPIEVQVVNLLVDPAQAEVLSLVSTEARVQLVLRNPLDRQEPKTQGVLLSEVLTAHNAISQEHSALRNSGSSLRSAIRPSPAVATVHVVEVFNGAKRTETAF